MARHLHWILSAALVGISLAASPVYLNTFLQPNDDIDRSTYLASSKSSNLCARECVEGEKPKICYYKWTVENYATISNACGKCPRNVTDCSNEQCITADGYERGVLSINRKIPGPSIEVCLGDRIVVDVTNAMAARTTTVHWHGVFQEGSQYMDGVPMLTQCSIYESNTFRYDFLANNEGTHFWHSHDGLQKLDGLEGNLVIRVPKSLDPNGLLYDYDLPEHKMFISDWLHLDADQHFPGLIDRDSGQDANSFLINGKGRTVIGTRSTITPYAQFNVESGKRYRFRIIGGLCTVCPIQLSIQGHTMLVIATDGNPVAPKRVDSINLFSGERYDIVLEANQQAGPYWIHVKGLATCVAGEVYQLGVLQYEGATTLALPYDPGYEGFQISKPRILNPENGTCAEGSGGICTTQLVNSYPVPSNILNRAPDYNFLLTFGFSGFNPSTFFEPNVYERYFVSPDLDLLSSTMNNISFVAPPAPPLSQPYDVPASVLCPSDSNGVPSCPSGESYCTCVHVLEIPLGAVVQLLLSDESPRSDLNHPFHLHGYAFYVMDMGQYEPGQSWRTMFPTLKTKVHAQSSAPALKDSIAVPSGGYAVIKFKADNPGYWFLHCHFMYHLATGMAVVLKVGQNSDLPAPPANFPKCNNFMNTVYTN